MNKLVTLAFLFAVGCGGAATPRASATPEASPAPDRVDAVSSMSGDASSGRGLFAGRCAPCHGASGQGGSAPRLGGVDETLLVTTLINGRAGGMPSFGQLSDRELADVTAFVMQLE